MTDIVRRITKLKWQCKLLAEQVNGQRDQKVLECWPRTRRRRVVKIGGPMTWCRPQKFAGSEKHRAGRSTDDFGCLHSAVDVSASKSKCHNNTRHYTFKLDYEHEKLGVSSAQTQ